MNSLVRQERRNIVVEDRETYRYSIEDYGRNGLELNVEVPDLTAGEIDLEITRENGVNTLLVRSNPSFHRRVRGTVSQSFVINDDTIDVDGVTARIGSEILTIALPRKTKKYRKRKLLPTRKDNSIDRDRKSEDGIVVFDSNSKPNYNRKERPIRQPVPIEETKISEKSSSIERDRGSLNDDNDLYISEAEDIW